MIITKKETSKERSIKEYRTNYVFTFEKLFNFGYLERNEGNIDNTFADYEKYIFAEFQSKQAIKRFICNKSFTFLSKRQKKKLYLRFCKISNLTIPEIRQVTDSAKRLTSNRNSIIRMLRTFITERKYFLTIKTTKLRHSKRVSVKRSYQTVTNYAKQLNKLLKATKLPFAYFIEYSEKIGYHLHYLLVSPSQRAVVERFLFRHKSLSYKVLDIKDVRKSYFYLAKYPNKSKKSDGQTLLWQFPRSKV